MTPAQEEANRLLSENPNHPQQVIADLLQRVSDAAKLHPGAKHLAPFILPEPVDPLRAALREIPDEDIREISSTYDVGACRERIAQVMKRHGLQIVPVQS